MAANSGADLRRRAVRIRAFSAAAVTAVVAGSGLLGTVLSTCVVSTGVLAATCEHTNCITSAAGLGRTPSLDLTRLQDDVRRIHNEATALPQRMEAISALLLGVPYKRGALGEGPDGEFDRDPLIRFDAFDCTTFVETVMALALDGDLDAATRTLQKLRYKDGQIGYATRNHFIELDWVPNNVRAGYLRDITSEVAGAKAVEVHKTISKRQWYARKSLANLEGAFTADDKRHLLPKLQHLGKDFADERATLTVLPMTALPQALAHIPSGTIANLVHRDQRDRDTIVSHQVILIKKSDGWYVRQAAMDKAVEDDPIGAFTAKYRDLNWRLVGLNLVVLHDPRSDQPPR